LSQAFQTLARASAAPRRACRPDDPGNHRQVVALRLFLDLDTGRTAEALGIAPGTVQAHLGRAIAALRADLVLERQQEAPS
jgi:DNA-directed RNA polymerase specialized sigma24 family protein